MNNALNTHKFTGKTQLVVMLELIVVAVFAGFGPEYPTNGSSASSWHFFVTHPTELLHALLGVGVLLHIIFSMAKSPIRLLKILVLAGVICSVVSGFVFVTSQSEAFLGTMTAGWLLALVAVGVDLFKARKIARQK